MTYALRIRRRMESAMFNPTERVRAALVRQESERRTFRIALALAAVFMGAVALALSILF